MNNHMGTVFANTAIASAHVLVLADIQLLWERSFSKHVRIKNPIQIMHESDMSTYMYYVVCAQYRASLLHSIG